MSTCHPGCKNGTSYFFEFQDHEYLNLDDHDWDYCNPYPCGRSVDQIDSLLTYYLCPDCYNFYEKGPNLSELFDEELQELNHWNEYFEKEKESEGHETKLETSKNPDDIVTVQNKT